MIEWSLVATDWWETARFDGKEWGLIRRESDGRWLWRLASTCAEPIVEGKAASKELAEQAFREATLDLVERLYRRVE